MTLAPTSVEFRVDRNAALFTPLVVRAGAQSTLFNWTFRCTCSLVQKRSILPMKDRAVLNLLLSYTRGDVGQGVYRRSFAGASGQSWYSCYALSSETCRTAMGFQLVFQWCHFQWTRAI